MTREEKVFQNFLAAEKKFLSQSKHFKSERAKKDLGEQYLIDLVLKTGKKFREVWDLSLCKECSKSSDCGNNLRIDCNDHEELK